MDAASLPNQPDDRWERTRFFPRRFICSLTAPPSPPAKVLALVNGSTAGLSWRNTFEGGAATSMMLDITGSVTGTLPFGLMESGTIGGVPDGTYTLRLRALNEAGSSIPSEPITVVAPGACSGAPQPPINVQVGHVGNVAYALKDLPTAGPAPLSHLVNVSGAHVENIPATGRSLTALVGPGVSRQRAGRERMRHGTATPVQTITVP